MEPGNPNLDRIFEWLRECNRHLSGARAFHASLNDGTESTEFDNRSCSPALPEQTVSCGYQSDSVSECFSQSAAKPIFSFNPSAVVHPAKKIFNEADLSLQSPTWIKFYDICKRHVPSMTSNYNEQMINYCLLKAIMKQRVLFETIDTIQDHLPLSDTQKNSLHRVYLECLEESAATQVTPGVKRFVNRQCGLTASMAKTSENVLPSKVASSYTRKKPLSPSSPKTQRAIPIKKPLPPSSPNTQRAILIKKPVQTSSSDARNYPELRQ